MRKYHIITVALVAACGAAIAGTWIALQVSPASSPEPDNAIPEAPSFTFVKEEAPVLTGGEAVFQIPVVNQTSEVVRLGSPRVSCACTSASLDASDLAPGQQTLARMVINLTGRDGNERFRTDWIDGSGRFWSAEVRVSVYRREQFDPAERRFGAVQPGQELQHEMIFRQCAGTIEELPQVPVLRVIGEGVSLTTGAARMEPLGPRLVCRLTPLTVTVRVPDAAGRGAAQVSPDGAIKINDPPPFASLDWDVSGVMDLYPARAVFVIRKDEPATELTRTVMLRPTAGTRITGVSSNDARVRVTLRPDSDGAALDVNIRPMNFAVATQVDVTVQTDRTGVASIRLPVSVVFVRKD